MKYLGEEQKKRAAAMPSAVDASKVRVEDLIVERAVHDVAQAAALLDWLGSSLGKEGLTEILLGKAYWARSYGERDDREAQMAWCDRLISKGADPFAPKNPESRWGSEGSFFESLMLGGLWAFAHKILDDGGEPAKAKASEAFARIDARGRAGAQWSSTPRALAAGGARALELGFKAGLSPTLAVDGSPWVFLAKDGPSVEAFAKAGADLRALDAAGRSMEQRVAGLPAGKLRLGMLAALQGSLGEQGARDPVGAAKALGRLARDGTFPELAKAAAAAGLDPIAAVDADGLGMLAIALEHANWRLALDLMKAGADPAAPSGVEGISAGGLAMWASSPRAKPLVAVEACKARCLPMALAGVDHAWRGQGGERFLEACAAAAARRAGDGRERFGPRLNLEAFAALAKSEPEDASLPMWARVRDLGLDPKLARMAAVARVSEPWTAPDGMSLMGYLVAAALEAKGPTGQPAGWMWNMEDGVDMLARALAFESRGEAGGRFDKMFAPEQWRDAFPRMWAVVGRDWAGQARSGSGNRAVERMERAVAAWARRGPALSPGWTPADMVQAICSDWPEQKLEGVAGRLAAGTAGRLAGRLAARLSGDAGGRLLLDILAGEGPEALAVGSRAWQTVRDEGARIEFPQGHWLMEQGAILPPGLAEMPGWELIKPPPKESAPSKARRL